MTITINGKTLNFESAPSTETENAAEQLAQAFWDEANTEKTAKDFAALFTLFLMDILPDGEDMATNILSELTYWLQPTINPYWAEDEDDQ